MAPKSKANEYWNARDLKSYFGYVGWQNFVGVVRRAVGIIKHKNLSGEIIETRYIVQTGHGAKRSIVDYLIDKDAMTLLQELCSSYKLNNFYSVRNETVILQMVEKYCHKKKIDFEYQYHIGPYIFDCMVADNVLIEFDEPHHCNNLRQKSSDNEKTLFAMDNGFVVYRVTLEMDIIDVIVYLESMV